MPILFRFRKIIDDGSFQSDFQSNRIKSWTFSDVHVFMKVSIKQKTLKTLHLRGYLKSPANDLNWVLGSYLKRVKP